MQNYPNLIRLSFVFFIFLSQACAVLSQRANGNASGKIENSAAALRPENNRMIHRDGIRIVDGAGKPLDLKGVNFGGWLMWEGWIFGGGFITETQMMNRLALLAGKEEAGRFRQDIYDNFITEADFREVARLGLNVVRVPFNHSLLEDDNRPYFYKESGWRVLDRTLDWAEKNKVYVVLDLHSAPGGQNTFFIADPEPGAALWKSTENKKRTVALWRAIAERYKNRPIIAAYDLLNEPKPPKSQDLVDLYREIIASIRTVDRTHMFIIEGADAARDFSIFGDRPDENMAYSFHMYMWFGKQRESDKFKAQYVEYAERHDVPLWCGEFGEDQPKEINRLVTLYNSNSVNAGYAFWTWKKVRNRTPALVLIDEPAGWKKVADWIQRPFLTRKPSKAEAQNGMRDFLEAARFENTTVNPAIADVLR